MSAQPGRRDLPAHLCRLEARGAWRAQPAPLPRWPSRGPIPPRALTDAEASGPATVPWGAAHSRDRCHGTGTIAIQDLRVPTAAACGAPRTAPSPAASGKDSERGLRERGIWGTLGIFTGYVEWETQGTRRRKVLPQSELVSFPPLAESGDVGPAICPPDDSHLYLWFADLPGKGPIW